MDTWRVFVSREPGRRWQQPEQKQPSQWMAVNTGFSGGPGATRTPDPQIRSLMLYPAELRDRIERTILPDLRGVSIPKAQRLRDRGFAGQAGELRGELGHEQPGRRELPAQDQRQIR